MSYRKQIAIKEPALGMLLYLFIGLLAITLWKGFAELAGHEQSRRQQPLAGALRAGALEFDEYREHDLAVIDVGAARLPEVLRILRSSVRHSGISLLVEAGRVLSEPSLAGVLPKYRTMPCSRSDLVKLARCLIDGDVRPGNKRMLL